MNKRKNFASLKSMKKGVGSGSISQRYGSGDLDPDPHQYATDPQNWCEIKLTKILTFHMYSVGASTVGCAKKIVSEDNF
jgi:hypothetical protein